VEQLVVPFPSLSWAPPDQPPIARAKSVHVALDRGPIFTPLWRSIFPKARSSPC
jgi:hypothetical protein